VVLTGEFDAAFLELPKEVIRTTIRSNQKCFVLKEQAGECLSNRFVLVANIEAKDGGAAIATGNARVVQARLSDAKFFFETDLKIKLEDRLASSIRLFSMRSLELRASVSEDWKGLPAKLRLR